MKENWHLIKSRQIEHKFNGGRREIWPTSHFASHYLHVFFISDPLPHSTCERTFEKVGCFVDKTGKKGTLRTLPDLLVNDRDPNSDAYDGHRLDWHKWPESIHR